MERLSCFPADCSSGSLAACSQGWLGIPEGTAPMDENLWVGIPSECNKQGPWAWSPWGHISKFDTKQEFFHGLEENLILLHFQKDPTGWILQGSVHR